jgi:hypothetical protein
MNKIQMNEKKISEIIRNGRIEYYKKRSKLHTVLNSDISELIIEKYFEENYKDGFYKMSLKNYLKFTELKLPHLEIEKINNQNILFYNKTDFIGEEIKQLEIVLTHFLKCINQNYRFTDIIVADLFYKINEDTILNKIIKDKKENTIHDILSLDDDSYSLYIKEFNVYSFITKPILDKDKINYLKKYLIDKKYDLNLLKKFFQVDDLSNISFRVVFYVYYKSIYNREINRYENKFVKKNGLFQNFIMEMPNGQLILIDDFIRIIENNFNLVSTDNKKNLRKNFYSKKINYITHYSQYPFTGLEKIYNDECDKNILQKKHNNIYSRLNIPEWRPIINIITQYNRLLI